MQISKGPLYRVSGNVMSALKDLIPAQKYHMNMSPIVSSYRNMGILNV